MALIVRTSDHYSLIHQIITEYLLSAKDCSRHWGQVMKQNKDPGPLGALILTRDNRGAKGRAVKHSLGVQGQAVARAGGQCWVERNQG